MSRIRCWMGFCVVTTIALYVAFLSLAARAQEADELQTLDARITEFVKEDNFDEATRIAERAVKLAGERFGPADARLEGPLGRLSTLKLQTGHLDEAEPVVRRLLGIVERAYGPDAWPVYNALVQLGGLSGTLGRTADAQAMFTRALAVAEKNGGEQHPAALIAMYNLLLVYAKNGHDEEAERIGERIAALQERTTGADAATSARVAGVLAVVHGRRGNRQRAEQLLGIALDKWKEAAQPDLGDIDEVLHNLGALYEQQRRYREAGAVYRERLVLSEAMSGRESSATLSVIRDLTRVAEGSGRWSDAAEYMARLITSVERIAGATHPSLADLHHDLGAYLEHQERDKEAEVQFEHALNVREKQVPAEPRAVAQALVDLALFYDRQRRYSEAESLHQRALRLLQARGDFIDDDVISVINNLAAHYSMQQQFAEAQNLYRRVIALCEQSMEKDSERLAAYLSNLVASIHSSSNRLAEPEKRKALEEAGVLQQRAVDIYEKKLGTDHIETLRSRRQLALIYFGKDELDKAAGMLNQILEHQQRLLGPEHVETMTTLQQIAALVYSQERYGEAQSLAQRHLEITRRSFGDDHLLTASSMHSLAWAEFHLKRYERARELFDKAARVLIARAQNPSTLKEAAAAGRSTSEHAVTFFGHVISSWMIAEQNPAQKDALSRETYELAQWALSSQTAGAVVQMAVRLGVGNGDAAAKIAESQSLADERTALNKELVASLSQPVQARSRDAERALQERIEVISTRLRVLGDEIETMVPRYSTLINPKPLTVGETQQFIDKDEALLQFLIGKENSFVWVVTSAGVQWARLFIGAKALADKVRTLRCGLDLLGHWHDPERARECVSLLRLRNTATPRSYHDLPFDLGVAHELYTAILQPVAYAIRGKKLLVVPVGALTNLPLHVLVASKPAVNRPKDPNGYQTAHWLGNDHAIAMLPSVGSLKAIRTLDSAGKPTAPYIGFGNPLLVGPNGDDRSAWSKVVCEQGRAKRAEAVRGAAANELGRAFRGGLADVEEIRRAYPLPETADELCAVAQMSEAPAASVHLGALDTEAKIKALSLEGSLANAKVVHIATHGLLAVETELFTTSKAEPALVFTPPAQGSYEDDGLLTASEVARLKLNADWVVLSACNTAAAGDKEAAEGFSGLARAFFYAGARALLVSHWYVNSQATVDLITGSFRAAKLDPKRGRAGGLQSAMSSLLSRGGPMAHPAYWAPFALVGEGR